MILCFLVSRRAANTLEPQGCIWVKGMYLEQNLNRLRCWRIELDIY